MKSSTLVILFAASIIVRAIPIAAVSNVSKRDPCDGVNALPVLYHEYNEDTCPAKNKFNSNPGECSGLDYNGNGCFIFCQVRTNFEYVTEVPFSNSYCHGPLTCSISATQTVTYSFSGTVSAKFLEALGGGVSGGFSRASATAHAQQYQIKLDYGECGYFTSVPLKKETCGTMTSSSIRSLFVPGGGGDAVNICDTSQISNVQNFCGTQPYYDSTGTPSTETIFVRTDCVTRQPLDLSLQDPVYQQPGVPLDRGVLAAMIQSWPSTGAEGDSCDVSYKFFFDEFEIRGKNWTTDQLGPNGANLQSKIESCGALTGWNFQITPDDPVYDWYISGNLPIGVKSCVGSAVEAAGGPGASTGNCQGPG